MATSNILPNLLLLFFLLFYFSASTAIDIRIHHSTPPSSADSPLSSILQLARSADPARLSLLFSQKKTSGGTSVPIASGQNLLQTPSYVLRASLGSPPQALLLSLDTGSDSAWLPCSPCSSCTPAAPPFSPPTPPPSPRSPAPPPCAPSSMRLPTTLLRTLLAVLLLPVLRRLLLHRRPLPRLPPPRPRRHPQLRLRLRHLRRGSHDPQTGPPRAGPRAPVPPLPDRRPVQGRLLLLPPQLQVLLLLRLAPARPGRPAPLRPVHPAAEEPHRPSLYYVNMTGISVGRVKVVVPGQPGAFGFDPATGAGTVVDSGTVVSRFTAPIYAALREEFRRQVNASGAGGFSSLGVFDTCFSTDEVGATPPITLHMDGGVDLTLPVESTLIHSSATPLACLAMAEAPPNVNAVVNVLANLQQQNLRVVLDVANSRVGFARELCN
uniref:Peptidase A1 domain-containing protein n=1 Tax=Ananas comosus var. bracteatus TaxID=296719 RepID=A0A6V7Q5I9_ANACO|nr:unnamed protein product [Ananas comosus var. bracteatus]